MSLAKTKNLQLWWFQSGRDILILSQREPEHKL